MRTCVLLAIVGTVVLACLGLHDLAFTDYDAEARPAFDALLAGRLHDFFLYGPLYGGSLVLRSPLAVLADLLGGGETAVFRAGVFPGLLAAGAPGLVPR